MDKTLQSFMKSMKILNENHQIHQKCSKILDFF